METQKKQKSRFFVIFAYATFSRRRHGRLILSIYQQPRQKRCQEVRRAPARAGTSPYLGPPKKAKKWAETHFSAPEAAFFAALCRARGSAPPRRVAAAYGVAYLSTKCLGEVKSSSGRAAMFVAAKTFFVRNLEIGPHSHSNYSNYDRIPTHTNAQDRAQIPEPTSPSAPPRCQPPEGSCGDAR